MRAGGAETPMLPGLAGGVLHTGGEGKPVGPAGQLSVQGLVEYQGRSGRFDDAVGQGFVVMALDADPRRGLETEQLAFLDLIGARLVPVSSHQPGPETVADLRGTYARWFREHGLPLR